MCWHLLVTFCSLHVALWMKFFEHKPYWLFDCTIHQTFTVYCLFDCMIHQTFAFLALLMTHDHFNRWNEAKSHLLMIKATVTKVEVGRLGDRVCVDLCSIMQPGGHLLVCVYLSPVHCCYTLALCAMDWLCSILGCLVLLGSNEFQVLEKSLLGIAFQIAFTTSEI